MGRGTLAAARWAGVMLQVLAASPTAADGGTPAPSKTVDLRRLQDDARANNQDIRAAEERWRAARARPSQQGALPDPMLNTAYHNETFDRLRQGASEFSFLRFGIEQEVPFPGKLARREAVAAREADREGALYRATVLAVLTRLRLAYDEYFVADKSLEIVRENQAVLAQLEHAAEARYEVGEGLQQDVVRAQVELSILDGRLTSLERSRQSAATMVNALLNRPPGAPLGVPMPIEKRPLRYSLEELERLARKRSPVLEAAEAGVARAETSLDLARREYYPDFVLRADYFNKAALAPEWEVGAGIRVPLYFWRRQAAGVREAAAAAGEARAIRQGAVQEVLAGLRDLYAQVTAADRLMELYGTAVVPQARLSLDSASAGYQVGKVDFLMVLSSFSVLIDHQVRYWEELGNFDRAVARIEEAAGIGDDGPGEGPR